MSHEVSSQHFTIIIIIIIVSIDILLVYRTKYDTMSLVALTGRRSLVAAPQSGLLAN